MKNSRFLLNCFILAGVLFTTGCATLNQQSLNGIDKDRPANIADSVAETKTDTDNVLTGNLYSENEQTTVLTDAGNYPDTNVVVTEKPDIATEWKEILSEDEIPRAAAGEKISGDKVHEVTEPSGTEPEVVEKEAPPVENAAPLLSAGEEIAVEELDLKKSPDVQNDYSAVEESIKNDGPGLFSDVIEPPFEKETDTEHSSSINEVIESPSSEGHAESDQNLLDTALGFSDASQVYWTEGNLEMAIESLDQAYRLVLKVDAENHPELGQQKDDIRFMISKRILEIYASRYTAVNGNHNEIPLIMNEHVKKEIKLFQTRERKFFLESYRRSGKYMGKIKKSLKEAGLPEDLAWLPLIESGFKVRALSRARALGLWQFIPSTGYKFGLSRDTWIDERLDPEKSTVAAIAYMKELHQIFGDWMTVLAGYNCGEGRVLKRIRAQKINYLDNFWDLYQQLPRETARYIPRFLATLHIIKNPGQYGFSFDEPDEPLSFDLVPVKKAVHLKTVARELGIPLKELAGLNSELRHKVTPSSTYSLKVPAGMGETLLAKLDNIPKWSLPKNAYVYHRVRRGETLSLIAKKYRTSVKKIVLANNIRRRHFIREGQKLKVPLRGSSVKGTRIVKQKVPSGGKYRIRKGDSLWLIAKRFSTTTKKLQRTNNLRTTRLRVGQTLVIPQ